MHDWATLGTNYSHKQLDGPEQAKSRGSSRTTFWNSSVSFPLVVWIGVHVLITTSTLFESLHSIVLLYNFLGIWEIVWEGESKREENGNLLLIL